MNKAQPIDSSFIAPYFVCMLSMSFALLRRAMDEQSLAGQQQFHSFLLWRQFVYVSSSKPVYVSSLDANWICTCLPLWQIRCKYIFTSIAKFVNATFATTMTKYCIYYVCCKAVHANMYLYKFATLTF